MRKIINASFVAPLICLALFLIIKSDDSINYYDLVRQFVLSITSVIIMIVYFITVRRYMKLGKKQGGVDSEQNN